MGVMEGIAASSTPPPPALSGGHIAALATLVTYKQLLPDEKWAELREEYEIDAAILKPLVDGWHPVSIIFLVAHAEVGWRTDRLSKSFGGGRLRLAGKTLYSSNTLWPPPRTSRLYQRDSKLKPSGRPNRRKPPHGSPDGNAPYA